MSTCGGYWKRDDYYGDGITKVTDPFWQSVCRKCGYTFLACLSTSACPNCGSSDADRWLGGISYDQIVSERGNPVDMQ